jgi:hypothetical protein
VLQAANKASMAAMPHRSATPDVRIVSPQKHFSIVGRLFHV